MTPVQALRDPAQRHSDEGRTCRTPWCCSTPIPTTRPSPPAAPWHAPSSEGHRVVLVSATRASWVRRAPTSLAPGEELVDRRVRKLNAAAEVLGVDRVEFLGYHDSGMAGEPTNDAPGSFASADVEEAAARLAEHPREEHADVLTVYDENGNYGHPDHIQVHRVGVARRRARGTPPCLRGDREPRPPHAPDGADAARIPSRQPRGARRRRDARRHRGPDHHHRRRRATSSTASARRWSRTPARSRRTRSSCSSRPTRSARRSAGSGSSAVTAPLARETTSSTASTETRISPTAGLRPGRRARRRRRRQQPALAAQRRGGDRSDDHGAYGAITRLAQREQHAVVVDPPAREVAPRLLAVGPHRQARRRELLVDLDELVAARC